MKKILAAILIMITLFTSTVYAADELLIAPAPLEKEIDVIVNGEKLLLDVAPVIVNDRTMLPMRAIFEALDANVSWLPKNRIIIATKDDMMITLQIENAQMTIQKAASTETEVVELDAVPFILNDRTMVPVRAVSEAFMADVEWVPETRTVKVIQNEGMNSAGTN